MSPGEKSKDFSANRARFSTLQPQRRRVPLALIRQRHSSSKNILLNFSWIFWYFLYIVGSQARQKEPIALEKIAKSEVQACCARVLAPAAVQKCMSCAAKVRRVAMYTAGLDSREVIILVVFRERRRSFFLFGGIERSAMPVDRSGELRHWKQKKGLAE